MKLPDVIDSAEILYARGCKLFRLKRGTKKHFIDTEWASKPFETFTDLFFAGLDTDCNIAVNVGASGLVVIDVDNGPGKSGDASLAAIGKMPETFTVRTPSGGYHYYFKAGETKYTQKPLAPYVDVRTGNGYVIAPGSVGENGNPYAIICDAPFAELPEWLQDRLTVKDERQASQSAVAGVDELRAAAKAISYLDAIPTVRGGERNNRAVNIANRLMDFGCSPETTAHLMATSYRCDPPMDAAEVEGIVERMAASRRNMVGIDAPEAGFEAMPDAPAAEPTPPAAPRNLLEDPADINLADIVKHMEGALVRELMHRGDTAVLYGDSGAGKSFCAIDLGWHIATGKPWLGRKTRRAPVLYVALEGVFGFRRRLIAAQSKYGSAGGWFKRLTVSVTLVQSEAGAEGARTIIEACKQMQAQCGEPVGLIVIDTLSQSIAGMDENATEVMSGFIRDRMGVLAEQTGACMLAVHHTNKQGQIRGSGTLYAASDLVMRADYEKDDRNNRVGERRTLWAQKVKDGEEGLLCNYKLRRVQLGAYEDGREITSAVIDIDDTAELDSIVEEAFIRHWPEIQRGRFSPSFNSPTTSGAKILCNLEGEQFFRPEEVQAALERLERRGAIAREMFAPSGGKESERWCPAF